MAEPLVDTPAPGMRLALCQCFGGNVIARLKGKGMVVALRDFANDESISDRLYTLHAVPSAHGDDYSPWSRALAFYRRSVRSYRTSMLQTRHKTKSLFAKGGGQRQKFGILSRRETEVSALIAQGLEQPTDCR